MLKIENIRCILLSAPYGSADHPEILECFPNGPKRFGISKPVKILPDCLDQLTSISLAFNFDFPYKLSLDS